MDRRGSQWAAAAAAAGDVERQRRHLAYVERLKATPYPWGEADYGRLGAGGNEPVPASGLSPTPEREAGGIGALC